MKHQTLKTVESKWLSLLNSTGSMHNFSCYLALVERNCVLKQVFSLQPQGTRKYTNNNTIFMYGETYFGHHMTQRQLLATLNKGVDVPLEI